MNKEEALQKVAVVLPAYRVTSHVVDVIARIGPEVSLIYVIDDCCPDKSGDHVIANCSDRRIRVVRNESNKGVGGAVMAGYLMALNDGADIIVKVDGDGQMDPALIPQFVEPILNGQADYTKGNRFYDLSEIDRMPLVRVLGNVALSFMSKISTGYWNVFDPTNGYTAIHANLLAYLPLDKISQRYFFETDVLFRLNTLRAVVVDVPMDASYGDEVSNLKIGKVLPEFLWKHLRNTFKRIFYNYYLRDLSVASFQLPIGCSALIFGTWFGAINWLHALEVGGATPTGTIMLSVLPIIVGLNLLLSFLDYDIHSVPSMPMARLIGKGRRLRCK